MDILDERGKRYGVFIENARFAQNLKTLMRANPGWIRLAPDQREALDMIAVKISRIINGDARWADNWIDIAGYATLVSERLETE